MQSGDGRVCSGDMYPSTKQRSHMQNGCMAPFKLFIGHTYTPPGFVPSVCGEGNDKNCAITQRERVQSAGA